MPLLYEQTVARYLNSLTGAAIVADVGGGKRCHFARYRKPDSTVRIVAVDVSEEEFSENRDVDETRVADVWRRMPFSPGEVDMVVSRSTLEHLPDVESFVGNAADSLRPGGYFIHVLPSRFAPYAIINRLLPNSVSKVLLRAIFPGSEGVLGFPAYYDRTYASSMRALLERHGFDVIDLRVDYYQSEYFEFLVPLYLASALYELVISALGAEDLAATIFVVARKG